MPAKACIGSPAAALDDFFGSGQQRRRNGEAEGFGGLQVDEQRETRGLLNRQIPGFAPFRMLSTWPAARRK